MGLYILLMDYKVLIAGISGHNSYGFPRSFKSQGYVQPLCISKRQLFNAYQHLYPSYPFIIHMGFNLPRSINYTIVINVTIPLIIPLYVFFSENVGYLIGIMISKTIGYNGVHNIFRHTHII